MERGFGEVVWWVRIAGAAGLNMVIERLTLHWDRRLWAFSDVRANID